ncbi:MFS transporter [Micromonospora sp. URMC 107]|uniref:MFS transporter n=1 Tax=Micromonospora sp. URMC 107 TaxID=3423418 RepID=UPI003F1C108C
MPGPDAAAPPGLFRTANFRWLLGARAMAVAGNALSPVATAFAVLELTGSATQLGLLLAARQLTQVLMSLVAGVVADRLERRRVIIGADLVAFASLAVAATSLIAGQATFGVLLATAAVNGAAAAFVLPAMYGLIPQVVPAEQLQPANAVLRMSYNVSSLTGIMVGGVVVATIGAGWALAANAATFLLSALLMSRIRGISGRLRGAASFLGELRAGWREFAGRRWLWVAVTQACCYNAAYMGALAVLGPLVAQDHLGGALSWSIIIGGHNVGYLVGGLVSARLRTDRPLLVGMLLMLAEVPFIAGLGFAASGSGLSGWLLCGIVTVAAFVGAIGVEVFGVLWDSTVQRNVPEHALSRVTSYDQLASFVFVPLGMAAMGPAVAVADVDAAAYAAAAVMALSVGCALSVPAVRRMRSGPTAEPADSAALVRASA